MASPRSLPPDEQRMHELAARFKRGRDLFRDFTWPGSSPPVRCRMRVIDADAIQLATAAALQRFEDIGMPVNGFTGDELANEMCLQVLARAIEDPDKPIDGHYLEGKCEPIFYTADELRRWTTQAERAAVFAEYSDLNEESDPDLDELTSQEQRDILAAIKKKDESTLRAFGARTLRSFLLGEEFQALLSPTLRSSTGSSAETPG